MRLYVTSNIPTPNFPMRFMFSSRHFRVSECRCRRDVRLEIALDPKPMSDARSGVPRPPRESAPLPLKLDKNVHVPAAYRKSIACRSEFDIQTALRIF